MATDRPGSRDDKKSMEQCAREHRDNLAQQVRLALLLRDNSDSDEIEADDWNEIEAWLEAEISCDNCGQPPSEHDHNDEGYLVCRGEPTVGDPFMIRDLESLRETATEQINNHNYGAGVSFTVDVTLYGGGPAGGIEFECGRTRYGLEMYSARQWHQDWFEPKGWAALDDDVASYLWEAWGLEYLMEGEG